MGNGEWGILLPTLANNLYKSHWIWDNSGYDWEKFTNLICLIEIEGVRNAETQGPDS